LLLKVVFCCLQIVYPEIPPSDGSFSALDKELLKIMHKVHLGHLLKAPYDQLEEDGANPPGLDGGGAGANGRAHVRGPREEAAVYGHQYTLDSVVNWGEVLSGGEKQRLSLAR
jgi:ABC-type uncharacterized transport system fused permease/ATPase subunit